MSKPTIQPRTLRGFSDTLPEVAVHRTAMLRTIERSFSSFGYEPIHTPALEYGEVLRGKGGQESDKQMFEFTDPGGRDVAMRFDLTVPLARFVAEHQGRLTFPFRAYQVGAAWRGERPQKGRYREFFQCDADIIGVTGALADAEMVSVIATTLGALGIGEFVLRVNDRRILNGLLDDLDVTAEHAAVLRALDKLDKVGAEAVAAELAEAGVTTEAAGRILAFAAAGAEGVADTFAAVEQELGESSAARPALDELRRTFALVAAAGVPNHRVRLDPAIARGLDYYTGIVYETSLLDAPEVGSISSGGRYDDLAGLYTSSRLPGVGGSIGLSRILGALEGDGLSARGRPRPLVVIAHPDDGGVEQVVALAHRLRQEGLDVEQYPAPRKHKNQMKFADARGARLMLTLDADGSLVLKDLDSGEFTETSLDAAVDAVKSTLG